MFQDLHDYTKAYLEHRRWLVEKTWRTPALAGYCESAVLPIFASSNAFFPYAFDRRIAQRLAAVKAGFRAVRLSSFGFCTSRWVLESTVQLLEWSPLRPVVGLIYEVTGNEVPAIDDEALAWDLKAAITSGKIMDVETGARIRQFLGAYQESFVQNISHLAELSHGCGAEGRSFAVILVGQETNMADWAPSTSSFSLPVREDEASRFHTRLFEAIAALRARDLKGLAKAVAECERIDPDVAVLHYLAAKLAAATGDAAVARRRYIAARDRDLLRGRFGARDLLARLPALCRSFGFSFIRVDAIIAALVNGAPGFELFVDDLHYRPVVHGHIADAVLRELAELALIPAAAVFWPEPSIGPQASTDNSLAMARLHTALSLAQAIPGPYDDERRKEGKKALAEAHALGCPARIVQQAAKRFDMILTGADRRLGRPADCVGVGDPAISGATFINDVLGFELLRAETGGAAEIEAGIAQELAESFGLQLTPARRDEPLLELGLDSLGFVQLIVALERRFAVMFDADALVVDRSLSFAELARRIRNCLEDPPSRRKAHRASLSRDRILRERPSRTVPRPRVPRRPPQGSVTIVSAIEHQMCVEPDETALFFLAEGGKHWSEMRRRSWTELDRESRHVAGVLAARGLGPNAMLLILTGHAEITIIAFIAALRLGVVPAILNPPSPKLDLAGFLGMFEALAARGAADAVLAPRALARAIAASSRRATACLPPILVAEDVVQADASAWSPAEQRPDDVALIQYSSGTTGLRKGTTITHGALMAQIRALSEAVDLRGSDVFATWLPLYHDMGLIGALALPLATGLPVAAMSPFDWIARPSLLLDALTELCATIAFMPNFAFSVMASRVPDQPGWDLSGVRVLVNCSEPVRLEGWRHFHDRFGFYGLSDLAHATCYAMAETTFAVTFAGAGMPPLTERIDAARFAREGIAVQVDNPLADARLMTSSGRALPGVAVRIVDAAGKPLRDRRVGNIVVASPFNASGYADDPAATSAAFDGDWYRTGDIGYRAEGHVFVVGRGIDRIIVAGENVLAADVEEAAAAVPGVKVGRVAAFGVPEEALGTEQLIIAAEMMEPARAAQAAERTRAEIGRAVRVATGVTPADIVLLPERTLSKTPSGKLERKRIRTHYLAHRFTRQRFG